MAELETYKKEKHVHHDENAARLHLLDIKQKKALAKYETHKMNYLQTQKNINYPARKASQEIPKKVFNYQSIEIQAGFSYYFLLMLQSGVCKVYRSFGG